MDINLSNLFIPTLNKARALKFLTFIFDCEVLTDPEDNDYTVLGNIQLYFLEADEIDVKSMPFCSFTVSEVEELENIKQKIQFFCYREDLEVPSSKLTENSFTFFDFDGNLWKIEYNQLYSSVTLPKM